MEPDRVTLARTANAIVVTACDAAHFGLAEELFASLRAIRTLPFALGFVPLCGAGLPEGLTGPDIRHAGVDWPRADAAPFLGYRVAYLDVKASLPALFPGYETYIWMDADCWVQNEDWLPALLEGAARSDLCAHPEYDPHYLIHPTPNDRTVALYDALYGRATAEATWRYPMVNAGVFAARATSPLWSRWSQAMQALHHAHERDPARALTFTDQIPLHRLIFTRQLTLYPLRAVHNWQTYACLPAVDLGRRRLTVPTFPHEEISVLHLAGDMKTVVMPIPALGRRTTLRYRDVRRMFETIGQGSC